MEYSDPSCGTLSAEFKSSGTFAIGNLIATDSGLSAKEIDVITLLENDLEVIENFFDIFRIDQGLLYTGDKTGTRDGSTGAKRPASLDSTRYLTKI